MKVTIIQSDISWENPSENIGRMQKAIATIQGETDLILLPELFTTGFSMQVEKFAESMSGPTIKWIKKAARDKNATISGSLMCKEEGRFYNRLVWVRPDEHVEFYDKRHLFTVGKENQSFFPGKKQLIVESDHWKIMPLICYDLRFPAWSRNVFSYDLLIYLANWPAPRNSVWETLLRARAIENQSYVIGVNRLGIDGEKVEYIGNSMIVDPKGTILKQMGDKECVDTFELQKSSLDAFRKKFPVLPDRDHFNLEI